jgi:hypothetical protein
MKKFKSFFRLAAIAICAVVSLLLSTGCTSPAQSKAMTPVGFKVARQHPGSVIVHTEGGAKTESGMPAISAPAFREALVAAINESRVFSSVLDQSPADYLLSVSVVSTKGSGALTLTISQSTRWQLTRLSDNNVLFNEFVTADGKATVGDAFVGVTRARMALERSGQENIKQGLTKLSELELQ